MKNTLIIASVIALLIALAMLGNIFLVHKRLSDLRPQILAVPSDETLPIGNNVIVLRAGSSYRVRAFTAGPILYPFGTWVMDDVGEIRWMTRAEFYTCFPWARQNTGT